MTAPPMYGLGGYPPAETRTGLDERWELEWYDGTSGALYIGAGMWSYDERRYEELAYPLDG